MKPPPPALAARPSAGPVTLVPPDPSWPAAYALQAERVRAALGGEVCRLEHVGSTSVPNLLAKPILDVLLTVVDSRQEEAYAPALEAAGFKLVIREPDFSPRPH